MASFFDSADSKVVPLIVFDGIKYTAVDETVEWLSSISDTLGVVACAGKYRTGKSFLQNCLCNSQPGAGFGVGDTVQACTKGIWIYKELFQGKNCKILFIDTEGIDALDADNTHDVRIFTLALLLSSLFVYNSVGAIDETAIQSLSLVTNITKYVKVETSKESTYEDLSCHMPKFIWMLRDFSLKLETKEGRQLNNDEYLEYALHNCNEQKEATRTVIKESFKERTLRTLPRPTGDENALNKLEFKRGKIHPRFLEAVGQLRQEIFDNIQPLKTDKHMFTGGMYATLCQALANNIGGDNVPVIKDAWSLMEDIRCRDVKDRILKDAYDKLNNIEQNGIEELMKEFDGDCPGSILRNEILTSITTTWNSILKMRKDIQEKQIRAELQQKINEIKKNPDNFSILFSNIDLENVFVRDIIIKEWVPELFTNNRHIHTKEISDYTKRIAELEKTNTHLVREKSTIKEGHDKEIELLRQENEHLKTIANDVQLPEIPEINFKAPSEINDCRLDDCALKNAESQIDELTSQKEQIIKQSEEDRTALRRVNDELEDLKAKNETLLANRMDICVIRNEINMSTKKTIENLNKEHSEQIELEINKRTLLEQERNITNSKLLANEETVRILTNQLEIAQLENRRIIEHYMGLHASFEDNHIRLTTAHKEALEDSRLRDEKHRMASEKLLQSNIEYLLKKEEHLRISEILKVENNSLKRKLEEDSEKIIAFKKLKSEMSILNNKFDKVDVECRHLRDTKNEIVKEREEIRNLFMQSDRELTILKASHHTQSHPI